MVYVGTIPRVFDASAYSKPVGQDTYNYRTRTSPILTATSKSLLYDTPTMDFRKEDEEAWKKVKTFFSFGSSALFPDDPEEQRRRHEEIQKKVRKEREAKLREPACSVVHRRVQEVELTGDRDSIFASRDTIQELIGIDCGEDPQVGPPNEVAKRVLFHGDKVCPQCGKWKVWLENPAEERWDRRVLGCPIHDGEKFPVVRDCFRCRKNKILAWSEWKMIRYTSRLGTVISKHVCKDCFVPGVDKEAYS